jgi:hypothetical protein
MNEIKNTEDQVEELLEKLKVERQELQTRIDRIDLILGRPGQHSVGVWSKESRHVNPMSLRKAIIEVTSKRPMTKQEILHEVQALGYRFGGKDPMKVINVVVYGKKTRFKCEDGRISPA